MSTELPSPSSPHCTNSRPPPADFTGRESELCDLRAAFEKGGVHISGLQGQGGVGKTALALKLAAELAPKFPDAQIYLDLKGVSEKPLTAAEALSHVLRTFHPEAKLPESEEDLCTHFNSVLHGKRALLLMDNVKDAAQAKSLIPPEGCTLLVTSRCRFMLPGLQQRHLDTLPPEDAEKLLLKIAPSIKDEAEAIARLCGYLALALRLAATAIAEHVDLDPAEYRKKLADEKQRLKLLGNDEESVEASITLGYNLLDAETQKRWRMLSVFPDTFDAHAAAAVWEMEIDAAKETLSRLVQFSIIEWSDSTKRYRLHDLMRDFARQRRIATESLDAARRHATRFLVIMRSANDLYTKGGELMMSGLALFDLEWRNIQVGQIWAAARAQEANDDAKLCSDYADLGAFILGLRQRPREQIRWREAALAAARKVKDRAVEARHLGSLGSAYSSLSDYPRAIKYYELDRIISREIGDRRGEGQTLGNLGIAYSMLGDYHRAIEYHGQALAIAREFSDRRVESNQLNSLANAYAALGDYHRAIEHLDQALAIAREIGDRRNEGAMLGGLGNVYKDLGDPRRAIDLHEQHFAIAHEIGDHKAEGLALGNVGLVHHALGEYPRAIECHEKRLAITREMGDRWGEGQALGNLGFAYHALGDFPRALSYHEQDLEITREIGDQRGEGYALWNMSRALDRLGDRKKAIEHAEAALKIKERIEDPTAARVRKQLEEWRKV